MRKPGLELMHLNSQLLKLCCFHASQEESFQTYSEHIQLLSSNLKIPWIGREVWPHYLCSRIKYKPMPSLSPGLFSCVVPQMCCKHRILCAAQPAQPIDYPEMMLRAVEIFLFHDPQPPENMMEWVGGRPPLFPLRTLELFASTREFRTKKMPL